MSSNPTVLAQKEPGKIAAPRPDNSNLVTALDQLGETSEYIDCPFCHKRTLTTVTQNNSDATWYAPSIPSINHNTTIAFQQDLLTL
jgi:hypothetical protein